MRRTLILQHRNGYTDSKNVITSVSEKPNHIDTPRYFISNTRLYVTFCSFTTIEISIYSSEGINMYLVNCYIFGCLIKDGLLLLELPV